MNNVEQNQRLEYLDDLTGLYNRRYFRKRLLEEKRKADSASLAGDQIGEPGSAGAPLGGFGLAMIDLDNFKPINDLYGHLTGDKVLSQVADLLKESIRPSDILCRYAGDEFVVIFPEIAEDALIRVAERMKKHLAEASWTDEKGESIQPVTCSLGYAFYSEKGKDLDGLVSWADQALYAAKRRGGNGYYGEKDLSKESTGRPLMHTPHIVGRENELRLLKSLLEEAERGETKLLLIHGEAGVGKTRLVRELRQTLERRGGMALLGNCHEETRSIPYYPFRDAFNRFFDEKKDAGFSLLKSLPEYSQRELARILPRLREMKPTELERAPDPFRLFEAVLFLLQNLSTQSENTILLIAEDLQWSDDASLELLGYLVRNLTQMRVLLCGTYRSEEKEGVPGLVRLAGLLRREKLSEEMPLEPLSAEGVSTMLRLLYPGKKIRREFDAFLYEKTEGNPLFVEELLKYLSEEEIGEELPKIREVPLSIYAVLQRRMDSLAPGMKEILACAALVGQQFEFEVLQRVQDRPQEEVLGAVDAAVKARIVRERFEGGEERYLFMHSLMAHVLYSGIGKVRRRLWHSQVGEALEELYAGRLEQLNGRLTYHFERGQKWEKALDYALKSARQARDDYANQEAIRFYEKAREMVARTSPEPGDEAIAIALELGDIYQITGDYDKAFKQYGIAELTAREKGDEKQEGTAILRVALVYQIQGNYNDTMTYAQRSYDIRRRIGDQEGVAESLQTMGYAYLNRSDYLQALKHLKESLKIRERRGDKRGISQSLRGIGTVHWERGDYDEALKCFNASLTMQEEIRDRRGMANTFNSIGNVYWSQGDYGESLRFHEQALKIRREIGHKRGVAASLTNIGNVHWGCGNYNQAFECHQESLKIDREIGSKDGVAAGLTNIGNIHFARGDYGEALKCHKESHDVSTEIGDRKNVALSLVNRGDVHVETGDYREALESYRESLAIQKKIGDRWGLAISLLGTGTVHQALYDTEEAMAYHREALSLIEKLGMKGEKTAVLARLGIDYLLAGDAGMALDHLRKASEIVAKFGTREAEPQVLGALGELWLGKGDPGKADEFCERLLRMADKEGLKGHLARAKKIKGQILLWRANPKFKARNSKQIRNSESKSPNEKLRVRLLKEAEAELREALRIAGEIGALPLLWQIRASLGRLYSISSKEGNQKKASEQFRKAKEIIEEIASRIGDEKLKNIFLNSRRVQSVLTA